jgi:hypothetical protein
VVLIPDLLSSADSVEKLSAWMAIMAAANDLARGDLLVMPPSVQMMVFVG